MEELGISMKDARPKSIYEISDVEYDLVVTMGCGDSCPHVRSKRTEDWQIPDPKAMDKERAREVRDFIREKVKTAIEEILFSR